jgi:hypothetical protein
MRDSKVHRVPVDIQINSSSAAAVQDSRSLTERPVRSVCSEKDMEKEISEDADIPTSARLWTLTLIVMCRIGLLSSAKRNVDTVECQLVWTAVKLIQGFDCLTSWAKFKESWCHNNQQFDNMWSFNSESITTYLLNIPIPEVIRRKKWQQALT